MTDRLLAKSETSHDSVGPARHALLTEHCLDVAAACEALLDVSGDAAARATGIAERAGDRVTRAVRLAAGLHDIGKANSHFQAMVTSEPRMTQLLRHEVVGGLILSQTPVRAWLTSLDEDVRWMMLWGLLGHHRKFDEHTLPREAGAMDVLLAHDDVHSVLRAAARRAGIPDPPRMDNGVVVVGTRHEKGDLIALSVLEDLRDDGWDEEERFSDNETRRSLALVKAFLIAADVAGSTLGKLASSSDEVAERVRSHLNVGLTEADIQDLVVQWAWRQDRGERIATAQLPDGFKARPFQKTVGASSGLLTLARAGCGSGKSLAAYLWAQTWAQRREEEGRPFRFFFCLPTTGTATEHFKDYALECGIDSKLEHSRASVDLAALAATDDGEWRDEATAMLPEDAEQRIGDLKARIDALSIWSKPLVVATADTVLGLMANARRSLCAFPAIVHAGIVFDEVHAFDDQLFGHLLTFLQHFPGIPVLLMTASLPEDRLRAIESVRPDLITVAGPPELEALRRYRISRSGQEPPFDLILSTLKAGGKVLWVRNRVDWASEAFNIMLKRVDDPAIVEVYHSRFTYEHRSTIHRRVIDRFMAADKAALLIATQVAEMSLDLSADLLVTDVAPIPSLIQRLGRLNRRATRDDPKLAVVCDLPSSGRDESAPYDGEELEQARQWLDRVATCRNGVSQAELAKLFGEARSGGPFDMNRAAASAVFVGVPGKSGIWRTRPGMTRSDGYTVAVVLEDDVVACDDRGKDGAPSADWLRRHEVSIPTKPEVLGWKRIRGVFVAPKERIGYDFDPELQKGTGARWREP